MIKNRESLRLVGVAATLIVRTLEEEDTIGDIGKVPLSKSCFHYNRLRGATPGHTPENCPPHVQNWSLTARDSHSRPVQIRPRVYSAYGDAPGFHLGYRGRDFHIGTSAEHCHIFLQPARQTVVAVQS